MSSIESRIAALAQDLDALSRDTAQDEASRKQLFGVIQGAMAKVEAPIETIWRMIMSPHAPAALMVLIRCGVLADLVAAGRPKTSKELSGSTGAAEMLIVRMMRPMTALGIFREADAYTYEATPISRLLGSAPPMLGGYQFMFDLATRSLANMPRYLEKTGFRHVDGAPGPFQDCNSTDELMFPYLMRHPAMMGNFNAFMAGNLETRPDWFAKFDAEEIVLRGARTNPEAVLLVDIAGGEGHDIERFAQAFPNAPGRLVLQELPPVIDNIKSLDERVERVKHDMFKEQPIRGARAYYMRYVFHDWPDQSCIDIMRRIAAAMVKGYSKLLIFEWILPAKGVPPYPALLDINMMALLNGKERTEDEWTALLSAAGLKVVKFHNPDPNEEGLIEAELA